MDEQYRDASNLNARIALHERFSTNGYGWMRWVLDQMKLPPNARVLEIGCGTGKLWAENADRIPEGWSIMLTDASPGMLREAESKLGDERRFRFRVADARELPFEDGTFDTVICTYVLHHVSERPRAISEMARVLGDGGTLYAATTGRHHLREMDWMMHMLEDLAHPDSGHFPDRSGSFPFGLENGAEQLSPNFPEISLRRYEDALVVTETQPLVDFALSTRIVKEATAGLSEEEICVRVSRLTESLEREIADHGALHITKDTGLFVARK